jgi:hypothetical protein
MAVDALSQPSGTDTGKNDNQQMVMLPEPLFIRVADKDSPGSVEHFITIVQNNNHALMKEWESTFPIERVDSLNAPFW